MISYHQKNRRKFTPTKVWRLLKQNKQTNKQINTRTTKSHHPTVAISECWSLSQSTQATEERLTRKPQLLSLLSVSVVSEWGMDADIKNLRIFENVSQADASLDSGLWKRLLIKGCDGVSSSGNVSLLCYHLAFNIHHRFRWNKNRLSLAVSCN